MTFFTYDLLLIFRSIDYGTFMQTPINIFVNVFVIDLCFMLEYILFSNLSKCFCEHLVRFDHRHFEAVLF